MNKDHLLAQLKRHEGVRYKPYRDTVYKLTIGVGRNLDDVPLSEDEVTLMLANDVAKAQVEANKYSWFATLSDLRQNVIMNMIFNLGPAGFAQFKQTHAAIASGDYVLAGERMKQSKWYTQVGKRADELIAQLIAG